MINILGCIWYYTARVGGIREGNTWLSNVGGLSALFLLPCHDVPSNSVVLEVEGFRRCRERMELLLDTCLTAWDAETPLQQLCSSPTTYLTEDIERGHWFLGAGGDDLTGSSDVVQFVAAIYWATTTISTVGYGDITPDDTSERIVAMCIMLLGESLTALMVRQPQIYLRQSATAQCGGHIAAMCSMLLGASQSDSSICCMPSCRSRVLHALTLSVKQHGVTLCSCLLRIPCPQGQTDTMRSG